MKGGGDFTNTDIWKDRRMLEEGMATDTWMLEMVVSAWHLVLGAKDGS